MNARWEYRSVYAVRKPGTRYLVTFDEYLNTDGADGWELVAVTSGLDWVAGYLKRKVVGK